MKKLIALFITFCLCLMLCACGQTVEDDNEHLGNSRFEQVYFEEYIYDNVNDINTVILVDKETGVMYLYVNDSQRGGLTVMVDEDGKPLIWEGDNNEHRKAD